MIDYITWPNGSQDPWEKGVTIAQGCVGRGWKEIVRQLMEDLRADGWDGELFQVKEKFGGLRFYTGGTTESQSTLIRRAEDLASETCMSCGANGKIISSNGWMTALCPACVQRRRSEV